MSARPRATPWWGLSEEARLIHAEQCMGRLQTARADADRLARSAFIEATLKRLNGGADWCEKMEFPLPPWMRA